MLYGTKKLQEGILSDIRRIEAEHNIRIVYAAETGSISRGLQTYFSDYDTRFLYVNRTFPEEICNPDTCRNDDIKMLFYPEKEGYFTDKYELREFTSFLQFLVKPSIGGVCRGYGLYYYLGWTFTAPYMWDPYGLNSKLLPLMNTIFRVDYMLKYHIGFMEENPLGEGEFVRAKLYLRHITSALSMEWALKDRTFPPSYVETLLALCAGEEVKKGVCRIYEDYYRLTLELGDKETGQKEHANVMVRRADAVDDYIRKIKNTAGLWLEKMPKNNCPDEEEAQGLIHKMYRIVSKSMEDAKVYGVNCGGRI